MIATQRALGDLAHPALVIQRREVRTRVRGSRSRPEPLSSAVPPDRGDFQTPLDLARRALARIRRRGFRPRSVLEPTCGLGAFLTASLQTFNDDPLAIAGFDIDSAYVEAARASMPRRSGDPPPSIRQGDMFAVDWHRVVAALPEPILVTGNPPWVTAAAVSAIGGANTPLRTPQAGLTGLRAITGKSNFDLSEWLLMRLLEACHGRDATIAMLVKTQVARRVLLAAWSDPRIKLCDAAMYRIDAAAAFGVAVDACWFVYSTRGSSTECALFDDLEAETRRGAIGFRDGRLIADLNAYARSRSVIGLSPQTWRSGIKHDCARVMELTEREAKLVNGFNETVDIEEASLFPMLKSSQVASDRPTGPRRWMVVPQRAPGEDTAPLERNAPRTWAYLSRHGERLDRRASAIYRRRPRFSIFGIGAYSFRPWKVAISGLYKRVRFKVIGPHHHSPVVFDDTVYFLALDAAEQARRVARLLESSLADDYFRALVFFDAKRPITAEILNGLDLERLAAATPRAPASSGTRSLRRDLPR